MQNLKDKITFRGRMKITTSKNGKVLRETGWMENRIVSSDTHGRNLVMRRLMGDNTYGIEIDSAEIGTDDTAAADAQTALIAPVVTGVTISNAIVTDDDELTLTIFMSDATLANGTYKEFALRIGAKLFSRVVISPNYSKSAGEDSTFTYVITLGV
jgi:hypothetical protein